jgi:hypothetical protein
LVSPSRGNLFSSDAVFAALRLGRYHGPGRRCKGFRLLRLCLNNRHLSFPPSMYRDGSENPGGVGAEPPHRKWRGRQSGEEPWRNAEMKLLLVLCGRIHDSEEIQVLEKLRGATGLAEYGKPRIQQFFSVGCDSAPNGGLSWLLAPRFGPSWHGPSRKCRRAGWDLTKHLAIMAVSCFRLARRHALPALRNRT